MTKKEKIILCVIGIVALLAISCAISPEWRKEVNGIIYGIRKADDATNYNTIKHVEDTCRAMIASYEADKLTWMQYKDSESEEQRGWAAQAMMRANRTAATYNAYILKNGFVWADNVPEDISEALPYLESE